MRKIANAWWIVALVILALEGSQCRADEITDKALRAFQTKAPDLQASVKSDNELLVNARTGRTSVFLYNVRTGCSADAATCDEQIATFVEHMSTAVSKGQSGAFVSERVHAVLRNAGYAKQAAEVVKESNKQLVVLPFTESLEVLFVVDSETAFRYVNRNDMQTAGLAEKALLQLAIGNLGRLAVLKYEPIKGMEGAYFMPASDGLGTARLFDTALWDKVEAAIGGPVAVSVPTRDWILFTRADRAENVAKMREMSGRIVRGEPYPVSAVVLLRDGVQWRAASSQ